MAIYLSEQLDLSRLPAPEAIRDIDFETIFSERTASLLAEFAEKGVPFDVENLETDSSIILEEIDGLREVLAKFQINDTVKALLIPFSTGGNLENLAAFYGVTRVLIKAADANDSAVYETDIDLRRRVLLATEAFATAGTFAAYVFHGLSADPNVRNVDVWSPGPGEVHLAVQSREGDGMPSVDLVDAVRTHLYRPEIKPLTDMLTVIPVSNIYYTIAVNAYVLPGPDPVIVQAEVEKSLAAMVERRRVPSRDVPRSAIYAAAQVDPVDLVEITHPLADLIVGDGEVAVCTGITVTVQTHDG